MKRHLLSLVVGLGLLAWSTPAWAQTFTCSPQTVAGSYTVIFVGAAFDTPFSELSFVTFDAFGGVSGDFVVSIPGATGIRGSGVGTYEISPNCWLTVLIGGTAGVTGRMVNPDTILFTVIFDPNEQSAGIAWRQQ